MSGSRSAAVGPAIVETGVGPVEVLSFGEGPAVLALHGAMGGYDQSEILAQTLGGAGYRFIAVSRPGYLGTPARVGLEVVRQGDACAALLDALGIERAGVMAVSGGGPPALMFASRHRERCWALVLVSTCSVPVDVPIPLHFHVTTFLARWRWIARQLERRATSDLEAMATQSIEDPEIRSRTLADPEVGPLFRRMMRSTFDRMDRRLTGTKADIRISRTTSYPLEEIETPALVVHGTKDKLVPYDPHATTFAARLPQVELLRVDEGEHVAIFTHRDLVRERVMAFLAARRPGAEPPSTRSSG